MKLPQPVLEKIEYYEVYPFQEHGLWTRETGKYDEVIIHFKPEPVLFGLWARRETKTFTFNCHSAPTDDPLTVSYRHGPEYEDLVAQLDNHFSE